VRTIIAGSRHISQEETLRCIERTDWKDQITTVLCGCAIGPDTWGERWAEAHGIPVERFPANWSRFGYSAGPKRNQQMVDHADALLAVWDGKSKGTQDVIDRAVRAGLKVTCWKVLGPENGKE
jgi:hypothetical protein